MCARIYHHLKVDLHLAEQEACQPLSMYIQFGKQSILHMHVILIELEAGLAPQGSCDPALFRSSQQRYACIDILPPPYINNFIVSYRTQLFNSFHFLQLTFIIHRLL